MRRTFIYFSIYDWVSKTPPSGSRELSYFSLDDYFDEDVLADSIPSAYAEDASRNEKIHREALSRFRERLAEVDACCHMRKSELRDPLAEKYLYLRELLSVLDGVLYGDGQPDFVNMIYDRIWAIEPAVDGVNQGDREQVFDAALSLMKEGLKDYLYQLYAYDGKGSSAALSASVNRLSLLVRVTTAATEKDFSR